MATENLALKGNNGQIFDYVRSNMSLDFQARVPAATQGNLKRSLDAMGNKQTHWNEFADVLVNRIGEVIARSKTWNNELAQFKRGMLAYGDSIEEVQLGLLKAHTYDTDRDYMEKVLFGTELPDMQSSFHSINRQDFYKFSVNIPLLRRAFLEEGGLADFVDRTMAVPLTSDNWDEFLIMCDLFRKFDHEGGFKHIKVRDLNSPDATQDDARYVLKRLRALGESLKFPSTSYNSAGMPTWINPEELVVFASPEFISSIDVDALAAAFNVDYMTFKGKFITIPQDRLQIDGCQAIITSRDWFVCADTLLENTSQWNPAGLNTNYFWHHHGIYSVSRFMPAIMLSTTADDEVIQVSTDYGTLTATIKPEDGSSTKEAPQGTMLALSATVAASKAPADVLVPQAVTWTVTGNTSPRTYVTPAGVLHVGFDEQAGGTVTVHAFPAYVPANAPMTVYPQADYAVTVKANDLGGDFPNRGAQVVGISVAGVKVAEKVAAGTNAYTVTVPKGKTLNAQSVEVDSNGPLSIETSFDAKTKVYTLTVSDGVSQPRTITVTATTEA